MIPVFAAMLVFASIGLFGAWYARSKNVMEERVRGLTTHRRAVAEQEDPFSQRVMFPAVHGFATRIINLLPTALITRSAHWLIVADSSLSLSAFLSIVLVTTTALPVAFFTAVFISTNGAPGRAIFLVPVIALVGFAAPVMILRRAAKNRQNAYWKALPDSLGPADNMRGGRPEP